MIVGWSEQTEAGVRIWISKDRDFSPDYAAMRCRRDLISKIDMLKRSVAWRQRENWRQREKHLDGLRVAVRIGNPDVPGAA